MADHNLKQLFPYKPLQKTPKGIFIRDWSADGLIHDVAQYVTRLNRICMPLLVELSMAENVPSILRYSSKGGFERLRKEFSAQFPNGSAFQRVAKSQFLYVSAKHPEFKEVANSWKFAHLICLGEDGLLDVDLDACYERRRVYVSSPEGVAFIGKLTKFVNGINEFFSEEQRKCKGDILRSLVYFDGITNRYEIKSDYLCEQYIDEIIKPTSNPAEISRRLDAEMNRHIEAERKQIEDELAEQGMQGEEIQAALNADRDLLSIKTN